MGKSLLFQASWEGEKLAISSAGWVTDWCAGKLQVPFASPEMEEALKTKEPTAHPPCPLALEVF